jgi:MOSC domain-containing protein YiiM
VHLYPIEHYAFWKDRYPDVRAFDQAGAFGENLSCQALVEDDLCLGDIFRIGDALIQCSHARQPCWKLNHRFGKKDVLKTVLNTTKSGSYFRVLEPGNVQVGDAIEQVERPFPKWPLSDVFRLIIGGGHKGREDDLKYLSQTSVLAEAWRNRARQLLAS